MRLESPTTNMQYAPPSFRAMFLIHINVEQKHVYKAKISNKSKFLYSVNSKITEH